MSSCAVILNPRANGGNGAKRWRAFLTSDTAVRAGLRTAAVFDGDQGPQDLDGWVSERVRSGTRRFVAAGGDGTVNLALNSILRCPERVALEPGAIVFGAVGLGSSNDFHKPHGAMERELAGGIRCRLDYGNAHFHDVGRVKYAESLGFTSIRHFIINASVGVTAEANWKFNEGRGLLGVLKRNWVDGAIVATALKTFAGYRNFKMSIALDGQEPRDVLMTNLGVVKNVHFSGQMRYDQPQPCDDGRLGVHLCEGMSRAEMVKLLSALGVGRFAGIDKTSSAQVKFLRVMAETPFALEMDGEVVRVLEAEFDVLARELNVCP